jgi:hypothetical protein
MQHVECVMLQKTGAMNWAPTQRAINCMCGVFRVTWYHGHKGGNSSGSVWGEGMIHCEIPRDIHPAIHALYDDNIKNR